MENNKLIAEFTGYVLRGKNTYEYNDKLYFANELKFHNDWNWLMEAVKNIESLGFDFAIYTGSSVSIINTKDFPFEEIISLNASSKIEAAYNAVVEFIKWYNLNK